MTAPSETSTRAIIELIETIAARAIGATYDEQMADYRYGGLVTGLPPEQQRLFVLAAADWITVFDKKKSVYGPGMWAVREVMFKVMEQSLPYEARDISAILDWSASQDHHYFRGVPHLVRMVQHYMRTQPLSPELETQLLAYVDLVDSERPSSDIRHSLTRLRKLVRPNNLNLPMTPGDPWADQALADVHSEDEPMRILWADLLNQCAMASGSTPSQRWLRSTSKVVEQLGWEMFKTRVRAWFDLSDRPRAERADRPRDTVMLPLGANADTLKGLAWVCSQSTDIELARSLKELAVSMYRKIPGLGPRCIKVGNACVWALGQIPGLDGLAQLTILKSRLKGGSIQKAIEKAIAVAAARSGLSADDVEELAVPTYGLDADGQRREQFGEYTAQLVVKGTQAIDVLWSAMDGKVLKAAPKAVKTAQAEQLKALLQAAKDIARMLPAQRDRIENLYLHQKKWAFRVWRERYLDHPLIGTLARRLIWKFSSGDQAASGIWHAGQIVGRDDAPLEWLNDSTQVELWHPLETSTDVVQEWREWLTRHEVQQPFKQAHREIYVLTEAEHTTRVYSNRFAAHIIRQHQFNALCAARDWKNQLRLLVDDSYHPPTRWLPKWDLRAEYWVEGIGDNYGRDTNASGTYLYLATDQVRFYGTGARQSWAHAGGGGYHTYGGQIDEDTNGPVPLENIPPLVFSEIMRDVDLFVGVASVGNDPNWGDGGANRPHQNYWHDYSFGNLSETAQTRKAVLERVIPSLKIANRCSFTDKFLVVQGELRTYKIHMGSGNILMEPNDQYLCIVPAQGKAATASAGPMFLPFEGDTVLAVILSKAFLLADDKKISDRTILSQINRAIS